MRQIKMMMALAVLAVCSYTDIKERNIYLFPLMITSAGALAVDAVSLVFAAQPERESILMFDIILPVAAGIVLIVLARAGRACMGMGDGYLMASLGFVTGMKPLFFILVTAFCGAAVFAFARIAFAKRHSARTIPFAPFVMAGFLAVMINEM